MKKSDFKQIIKEAIEEEAGCVDEIGKFFVVMKPSQGSTKDDIMREVDVFESIPRGKTLGVYKSKSDASRKATEAVLEYGRKIDELKAQMDDYRKSKSDIKEKQAAAKELIKKLKQ